MPVLDASKNERKTQLNAFVFPSHTDFRFLLLVLSILGATLFAFGVLRGGSLSNSAQSAIANTNALEACLKAQSLTLAMVQEAITLTVSQPDSPTAQAVVNTYARCTAADKIAKARWMAAGALAVFGLGGLVYWMFPTWIIRRRGLVPFHEDGPPDVLAALSDLARVAGMRQQPIFVWNPTEARLSALAFGRFGRRYVAVSAARVLQFYEDPAAFRAVVLHELAHLRNADVDKTYFAIGVSIAFTLLAALPLAIVLSSWPVDLLLNVTWRTLAMIALVFVSLCALLRARELYADARASAWEGPGGALGNVLATMPLPKRGNLRGAVYLGVHPSPELRRQSLVDADPLFRLRFWDAFGIGLAVTVAASSVQTLVGGVTAAFTPSSLANPWLTAVIFSPLLGASLAAAIWRGALVGFGRGELVQNISVFSGGLGLGLIAGNIVAVDASSESPISIHPETLLISQILLGGVAFLSLLLLLRWIAWSAAVWVEASSTGRAARAAYLVSVVIATGLCAMWLSVFFTIYEVQRNMATGFSVLPQLFVFGVATGSTLATFATLLFLQAAHLAILSFPLAAWWWHRQSPTPSGHAWAFVDSASAVNTARNPDESRFLRPDPRNAVRVGLLVGGVLTITLVVVRLLMHATQGGVDTAESRLVLFFTIIGAAIFVEAMLGGVIAAGTRPFGVLHGLLAAFVAGCLFVVGILVSNLLVGGSATLDLVNLVYALVILPGVPGVLVVAFFSRMLVRGTPVHQPKSGAAS